MTNAQTICLPSGRSPSQYRGGRAEAVLGGSHAQAVFFVEDATKDILFLLEEVDRLGRSPTTTTNVTGDEANAWKAKSIGRGKLLERFRCRIQEVVDHAADEGDRVYFGSSNHYEYLKSIADEMDMWNWDAVIRERPEADPYADCRHLRKALRLAVGHIEHMAAHFSNSGSGYSFESLGEDLPGIKAVTVAPAPTEQLRGDVEAEIARVVQSVNEWDDRTSPENYPDHLLVTSGELSDILRNFASTISNPETRT